jgi:hypothetical protein
LIVLSGFLFSSPIASSCGCTQNWRNLRNGKPVNFIPQVDAHLDYWFKKDSLWMSEELDAVPDCDPDRVCILQVRCTRKDFAFNYWNFSLQLFLQQN